MTANPQVHCFAIVGRRCLLCHRQALVTLSSQKDDSGVEGSTSMLCQSKIRKGSNQMIALVDAPVVPTLVEWELHLFGIILIEDRAVICNRE